MQQDEKIENLLDQAEYQYSYFRKRLMGSMKFVMENLQRELKDMEQDENYCPNRLGVIQGSGASIDVDCSNISQIKEHIDVLKRLLKQSKKEN